MPWLRPGWVSAWRRAFGRGSLLVLALRRDGRLAGVVPLERRYGTLRSASNWHTPEFGLLAEDSASRRELAAALLARGAAEVRLWFLSPEAGLAELEEAAEDARHRLLVRTLQRSPYVPIGGDWEAYLSTLDRKDMKEIRRVRRRLEEAGETRFDVEDGSERLDALIGEWLRVESSGWKTQVGSAVASDPRTTGFYRAIAGWAAERGSLRLTFLRLDGRAIACDFHLVDCGSMYNLKGGYDGELRRFAPGMISAYEALRYAFAHQLATYEFLGREEPYKLVWAKELRDRLGVQSFPSSVGGLAAFAANAYGRPLAKRLLRR